MWIELVAYAGDNLSYPIRKEISSIDPVVFFPEMATFSLLSVDSIDDEVDYVLFKNINGEIFLENHCQQFACSIKGILIALGSAVKISDSEEVEIGLALLFASYSAQDIDPIQNMQQQPKQTVDDALNDLVALAGSQSISDMLQEAEGNLTVLNDSDGFEKKEVSNNEFSDADNPLGKLADEYRRVLLNLDRGETYTFSSNTPKLTSPLPKNPFAQYAGSKDGFLLDDLFDGKKMIDEFLSQLDDFGQERIFMPDEHVDVLEVLAPEGMVLKKIERAGQLTLHGHHQLSIDSHFTIKDAHLHNKETRNEE
ncbi:TagK domain-containing protein [Neisseriaceae bacterium TC5R-5]|nr:TagK domain-containing protein [Neisseriaceae bacterium TC5R-5]